MVFKLDRDLSSSNFYQVSLCARQGTESDTAREGRRAVRGRAGLGGQGRRLIGFLGVSPRRSKSLEANVQKAQSFRGPGCGG